MSELWIEDSDGELWLENKPRKRRKRRAKSAVSRRRSTKRRRNPVRAASARRNMPARRRRRSNPPELVDTAKDAAYAFGGYYATSYVTPKVSMQLGLNTAGLMGSAVQAGVAYGLGTLAKKFLGPATGKLIFLGGMIKVIQDLVAAQGFGVGEYAYGGVADYPGYGLGEYNAGGDGYDIPVRGSDRLASRFN